MNSLPKLDSGLLKKSKYVADKITRIKAILQIKFCLVYHLKMLIRVSDRKIYNNDKIMPIIPVLDLVIGSVTTISPRQMIGTYREQIFKNIFPSLFGNLDGNKSF